MKARACLSLFLLLALCACLEPAAKGVSDTTLHRAILSHSAGPPRPEKFTLCHGYGCRLQEEISLTRDEWMRVRALFSPAAATPEAERAQLRRAVGYMERVTGARAGTSGDLAGTFTAPFAKGQMDCEDEMLNAGTYMLMFEKEGLVRHHRIAGQAHRGYFLNGWPHMAVLLQEKRTGRKFVLDSWFHDNGAPAEIVELKKWRSGWKPGRGAR